MPVWLHTELVRQAEPFESQPIENMFRCLEAQLLRQFTTLSGSVLLQFLQFRAEQEPCCLVSWQLPWLGRRGEQMPEGIGMLTAALLFNTWLHRSYSSPGPWTNVCWEILQCLIMNYSCTSGFGTARQTDTQESFQHWFESRSLGKKVKRPRDLSWGWHSGFHLRKADFKAALEIEVRCFHSTLNSVLPWNLFSRESVSSWGTSLRKSKLSLSHGCTCAHLQTYQTT